jgi:hypothetical protein
VASQHKTPSPGRRLEQAGAQHTNFCADDVDRIFRANSTQLVADEQAAVGR